MERITSRKNARLRHFRQLGRERAYRTETGEFLCDGDKLLTEALQNGAEVTAVLYRESRPGLPPAGAAAYTAADELFDYASPLVNSPGPLFTVKQRPLPAAAQPKRGQPLRKTVVRIPGPSWISKRLILKMVPVSIDPCQKRLI